MPRTVEEALDQHLHGWNIRCNFCGDYGASWIINARPRWGALALCEKHAREYEDMMIRHARERAEFQTVKFEQEHPHVVAEAVRRHRAERRQRA